MARLVKDSNVYHNNGANSTNFVFSKVPISKHPNQYNKEHVHMAFGSNVLHSSSASYANSYGQQYRNKIFRDLQIAKDIVDIMHRN